ncbi:hypothetical protein HK405_000843, partial [Cladochytrium tenue]
PALVLTNIVACLNSVWIAYLWLFHAWQIAFAALTTNELANRGRLAYLWLSSDSLPSPPPAAAPANALDQTASRKIADLEAGAPAAPARTRAFAVPANPFDLGPWDNCVDFWAHGAVLRDLS